MKTNKDGEPMQPVVRTQQRVQTYSVTIVLACGHAFAMPVSARRINDPKALPKSRGCWQCQSEHPEKWPKPDRRSLAERTYQEHLRMSGVDLGEHLAGTHDVYVRPEENWGLRHAREHDRGLAV